MTRKTQMLMAGAGAAAGIYGLTRLLGGKHINTLPYGYGIKMKRAVTVNASPDQLYAFWRRLENLHVLFDNAVSVKVSGDKRSHWTLRVPGGMTLSWDAEITVDRSGEMIGWRSLEGADLDTLQLVAPLPQPWRRARHGLSVPVSRALRPPTEPP